MTQTTMDGARAFGALHLQDRAQIDRLNPVVVLYVLFVLFPLMFPIGPLALSTLRVMMMILIIPLMIAIIRGKYDRVYPADIMFPIFIGWSLLAIFSNNPDRAVEYVGSTGLEFLGGYALGRTYIRNAAQFVALSKLLLVAILCLLPFAAFETLTGRALLLQILDAVPGTATLGPVGPDTRLGLTRVQAAFAHPIHFGLFCSIGVPLVFVALNGVIGDAQRWIATGLVIACGFMSLSSGALIAIILQIGLIAWAALFDRITWRWWLLVGLVALSYIVIDLLSNRTPIRVFLHYMTLSAHTAYWRLLIFEWGMVNVQANPIFGIGLNDWVRPQWMPSPSVDNYWLLLAMRFGVPGLLLMIGGMLWAMIRIMRRDFGADLRLTLIRRAWIFTFIGLMFTLSTVHIWHNIFSFVYFIFGAGMWLIAADSSNPEQSDSGPDPVESRYARHLRRPGQDNAPPALPSDPYTRFPPHFRTSL